MSDSGKSPGIRCQAIGLLLASALSSTADTSLASRFSQRIGDLKAEIDIIDRELATLPDIPQNDSGGSEAYAKYYASVSDSSDLNVDSTIRFTWADPAAVDLISLIPARKNAPYGLDAEYGFPADYSLTLTDATGKPLHTLSEVGSSEPASLNRGLPYNHHLKEPVTASSVELRVTRLRPARYGGPAIHFFALSEIFCFSGERNLTENAEISFSYDPSANSSPYWSPEFMIDEITPLGLPEQPLPDGNPWKEIGWISNGKITADLPSSITIDLGKPQQVDGFRMFPAIRPSLVTIPGFGIPRRYWIETSTTGEPLSFGTVLPPDDLDFPNPGNNPVTNRFPPTVARFVRLRSQKLWKPFQHYPAFLAFSEVQVLNGEENLANGAAVKVMENQKPFAAEGNYFWSTESLTDGHGRFGKLLPRRIWLERLGRRKVLETSRNRLVSEIGGIEDQWRLATSVVLGILGAVGMLAALFLPIQYRIRERRKIRKIRDRIAGDLHDDVGSNLGSIQLLAGTAQSKSDNTRELLLINQVAAETVTSVRDIVWLLRPRTGERDSTISHLRESASFLLDSIDWNLSTDLDDFALSDEDGRNLVLFFREALNNLIRHSGATKAEIRIHRTDRELCFEIEDNGCGIPPESLQQERTLRALKQRGKSLGGRLEIDSKVGERTRLRLSFTPQPCSASHALRYPFPDLAK